MTFRRVVEPLNNGRVFVSGGSNVYHLPCRRTTGYTELEVVTGSFCGLEIHPDDCTCAFWHDNECRDNSNLYQYNAQGRKLADLRPCEKCITHAKKYFDVKEKEDIVPRRYTVRTWKGDVTAEIGASHKLSL